MTRNGPGLVGSETSAARSQPRYKVGGLESLVHCRASGGARKMPALNRQPASSPSSFKQVFVYTQNQSFTSPHLFRDQPVQYFLPPLRRCPELRSLSTSSLVRHRTRSSGGRCVYLSNVSVVSGEGQLDGEVVCLLIWKSLEQLAFSSLVAHKASYANVHADFAKNWRVKRLLECIEAIHPDFYPEPVVFPTVDTGRVKHLLDVRGDDHASHPCAPSR
jgi:hypothetical protein